MAVELRTKLEDLSKNLKYWISQGFTDFKVYIVDYDSYISFNIKSKNGKIAK
jgi:hypothetical protein